MKARGRVSKLTPEITERAAQILRETGIDAFAYKGIGISRSLFYKWKNENPDFNAAMEEAKKAFLSGKSEEASTEISLAKNYLLRCLSGQEFQFTIIERKRGDVVVETEIKKVQVLPPSWYLEKLFTGSEDKKEYSIRIGIARTPKPSEAALEEDLALHDDEQDQYEHFDSEEVED